MSAIDPAIVEVLKGHYWYFGQKAQCKCEWRHEHGQDSHAAHLAQDVVAPLIADAVKAAEAKGFKRGAAEGWDEGYSAGVSAPANRAFGLGNPVNPYRAALAATEDQP